MVRHGRAAANTSWHPGIFSRPIAECYSPFHRKDQLEDKICHGTEPHHSALATLMLRPYHAVAPPTGYLIWRWSGCCGLGNSLGPIYATFLLATLLNRTWVHRGSVFDGFEPPGRALRGWRSSQVGGGTVEHVYTGSRQYKQLTGKDDYKSYSAVSRLRESNAKAIVIAADRINPNLRMFIKQLCETSTAAHAMMVRLWAAVIGMHPSGAALGVHVPDCDTMQLVLRAPIVRQARQHAACAREHTTPLPSRYTLRLRTTHTLRMCG
jgi:hypothetical protein